MREMETGALGADGRICDDVIVRRWRDGKVTQAAVRGISQIARNKVCYGRSVGGLIDKRLCVRNHDAGEEPANGKTAIEKTAALKIEIEAQLDCRSGVIGQ